MAYSNFKGGNFLGSLLMYVIQHCFICRPSDSTVSEDAGSGIEPGLLQLWHWHPDALTTWLDLVHRNFRTRFYLITLWRSWTWTSKMMIDRMIRNRKISKNATRFYLSVAVGMYIPNITHAPLFQNMKIGYLSSFAYFCIISSYPME
jgi:hypothetical protein